jgi:ATP-dependent DNA helicase RecG
MPMDRKGIKTRIITPTNFEKFLSFISTRLSLGEQIYIVVPAIFEQEEQSFITIEKAQERFTKFFPNYIITVLHGKMETVEKVQTLENFASHKSDILLATSVIEVGIDIKNATTMAILSPERFGLSSLHQLRGRVGRGDKPGFCFLVTEKEMAKESMARLEILENSCDGFEISEKDLQLRGEGNLFGTDQSGDISHRLGNIINHGHLLEAAREDIYLQLEQKNQHLLQKISQLMQDEHIIKTI